MELFKLYGSIMVDSDQAQKSIKKTTDEANSFADKLGKGISTAAKLGAAVVVAATTAAAGLTKLATNAASTCDNIDKMSQRLGLSREAFQELDFALSQSGVDINSFQTGMKQLLKNMDGVIEGNKTATANFEILGVAVQDASGKMRNQEDVLFDTIKAFQGMEDSAEKSRLAQEMFGKQGQEIIPLLNAETGSIEEMRKQAHELGLVLDNETIDSGVKLTDTIDQMKRALGAVVTHLGAKMIPVVQKFSECIIKNIPKITEFAQTVGTKLAGAFSSMESIFEVFIDRVLPDIFNAFNKIGPVISDIASDILPILSAGLSFLAENFTTLVSVIGITVAAFKTMQIVGVISTAVQGATTAFGALSAVMASHPIGMVATAIGGLVVGITALTSVFGSNTEVVSENVKAARESANAAREESQAFRDMKAAVDEKAAADLSNISNTERLWSELQKLTDETGKVSEADRARAEFIIGELNDALGTEIEMVDGQIQSYEELQESIANTIEMKKAEIMLQANEEAYTEAVKNCNEQKRKSGESYTAWRKAQSEANRLYDELEALKAQETANMFDGTMHQRVVAAEEAYNEQAQIAANLHSTYDESADLYAEYCSTIEKYEAASVAMQQGNAEEVMNIYDRKGQAMLKAADIAGQATEQQKQQFLEQAQQMSAEYAFLADEYLKGTEGITEEMVQKAGEDAELAWSEYQKVGGSMSDGIISGALSGSDAVNKAIMAIVTNGLNAGQGAATTYSSSTGTSNYVPKSANTTQNASWYAQTYGGRAHAKGGIVKKGEIAFLEGEGTEAVVPLEKNKEWISRVAEDMNSSIAYNVGNVSNKTLEDIYELMKTMAINLPEMMADAMASVKLGVDKREFGRLVRQVNA